jgi:hypothetical protein
VTSSLVPLSKHQYDASGQVSDLTWDFHAHQCDLYNTCCIDETVTTNTRGLPTDAEFKFHYECPADHTTALPSRLQPRVKGRAP